MIPGKKKFNKWRFKKKYSVDNDDPQQYVKLTKLALSARRWDTLVTISFCGFDVKYGLESVIGLFPVIGDAFTLVFNFYMFIRIVSTFSIGAFGIFTLLSYIFIDNIMGVFPILGDLCDMYYKCNKKSVIYAAQWMFYQGHKDPRNITNLDKTNLYSSKEYADEYEKLSKDRNFVVENNIRFKYIILIANIEIYDKDLEILSYLIFNPVMYSSKPGISDVLKTMTPENRNKIEELESLNPIEKGERLNEYINAFEKEKEEKKKKLREEKEEKNMQAKQDVIKKLETFLEEFERLLKAREDWLKAMRGMRPFNNFIIGIFEKIFCCCYCCCTINKQEKKHRKKHKHDLESGRGH